MNGESINKFILRKIMKNLSNLATKVIRYEKDNLKIICKHHKKDSKAFYKYVKQKMKGP